MWPSLLLLAASAAQAQEPWHRWRTVRTDHYVVHYPARAEAWALDVATQLDDVHQRVVDEVGWAPSRRVQVVVRDPYSDANGSAWPFLRRPQLQLWATPPPADSVIGAYRSWTELLVTHEDAHLVHLTRPSRNAWSRMASAFVGFGPVALKSPAWVVEGYATVVEGRLTGSGRPNADVRAALLRGLAEQGRLPTYGELASPDRYAGRGFPYLIGSAYLEWLEARAGAGSLRDLWARMTARRARSFEEAFTGIWGDSPDVLYARFAAELTHAALAVEQPRDEGTLFEDLAGETGTPAVSPDGARVAVVHHPMSGPPILRIWDTAPDEEAEADAARAAADLAASDPDDVPDRAPAHPPHRVVRARPFGAVSPGAVHWLPSGGSLLVSGHTADVTGRYRADLYRYDVDRDRLVRLTRRADVRDAHPFPGGERALAVRYRWGEASVVAVDLDSGAVDEWTTPSAGTVVSSPRVSSTGAHAAWLVQEGAGWEVVLRDLTTGDDIRPPVAPDAIVTQLAWDTEGTTLVGAVGQGGFVEIREIWRADGDPIRTWTRSGGFARGPAPAPDGSVFHTVLDDDGLELHRTPVTPYDATEPTADLPIVRPAAPAAPAPPTRAEVEPRPYALGPTRVVPIVAGGFGGRQGQLELGVRFGDLAGRWEQLAIGAWGSDGGSRGGLASTAWRVLPVQIRAEGYGARLAFGREARAGGLLGVSATRHGTPSRLAFDVGVLADTPLRPDLEGDRQLAYGTLSVSQVDRRAGRWAVGTTLRGQAGRTGRPAWARGEGIVGARVGRTVMLHGQYTLGWTDAASELDQYRLGGVATSIVPAPFLWSRITDGLFPVGSWSGAIRDEARVSAGTPVFGVYGVRHRLGDDGLGARGASAVGIQAGTRVAEEPFVGTPDLSIHAALACRIEDPFGGWAVRPCASLADYGLTTSVVVRR